MTRVWAGEAQEPPNRTVPIRKKNVSLPPARRQANPSASVPCAGTGASKKWGYGGEAPESNELQSSPLWENILLLFFPPGAAAGPMAAGPALGGFPLLAGGGCALAGGPVRRPVGGGLLLGGGVGGLADGELLHLLRLHSLGLPLLAAGLGLGLFLRGFRRLLRGLCRLFRRGGGGLGLVAPAPPAAATAPVPLLLLDGLLLVGLHRDGGHPAHGAQAAGRAGFVGRGTLRHKPGGPLPGDLNALPGALAVAEDPDLAALVALGGLGGVVQTDGDLLPQQVHGADVAHPVGGVHEAFVLGHILGGLLVGVLLVLQAAHEPAAGPGDLGGVQAQVLGLGHLDGHGDELFQELAAAQGPAADAQAPQHLRFVPDADLPQLDPGPEHAGQVLHQLTEVHPALGGEKEDDLVALKVALHAHQLHLQLVGGDLLLADGKGLPLPAAVVGGCLVVVVCGDAYHRAQGLDHALVVHLVVALHALDVLDALGGLHHHVLLRLHLEPSGVKIVVFRSAAKADADDFCHNEFLLFSQ